MVLVPEGVSLVSTLSHAPHPGSITTYSHNLSTVHKLGISLNGRCITMLLFRLGIKDWSELWAVAWCTRWSRMRAVNWPSPDQEGSGGRPSEQGELWNFVAAVAAKNSAEFSRYANIDNGHMNNGHMNGNFQNNFERNSRSMATEGVSLV